MEGRTSRLHVSHQVHEMSIPGFGHAIFLVFPGPFSLGKVIRQWPGRRKPQKARGAANSHGRPPPIGL